MALFEKNKLQSPATNEAEEPSWLRNLEEMREKRKEEAIETISIKPIREQKDVESRTTDLANSKRYSNVHIRKTSAEYVRENNSTPQVKNKIYKHYLKTWEQEHNRALESKEADTQILLANQWTLKADTILLRADGIEEEENSVLFFNEEKQLEQATESQIKENADMNNNLPNSLIKVTVVKPNLDPNKNIHIIDEKEFVESIKAQLKPHLQDMLEGMIKNMLLNNYDIMLSCVQKEIQSQIPDLLDQVLEYNVKNLIKK